LVFSSFTGLRICDGIKIFLEKSIKNLDEKGFDLVLSNGGYTHINRVSIAFFAIDKQRATSVIKKLTNPNKRQEELVYFNKEY
jgi:hypothetical protein